MCHWHSSAVSSIEAEIRAHGTLLQRLGKVEIRRARIDRVAAEDEQQIHLPAFISPTSSLQRAVAASGGLHRLRVDDRVADVAERTFIACASAWTAGGCLRPRSRRRPRCALQILDERTQPPWPTRDSAGGARDAKLRRHGARQRADSDAQRQR